MKNRQPSISDLLAGHADVLHTKWRFNIQKRIVELNEQKYVLYRFRWKRTKVLFEETIGRLERAGIAVQTICASTSTLRETVRHGHWIALSYLPGQPMGKNVNQGGLASLGRTMGRLNALEGPPLHALFQRKSPTLPHEAYLERDVQLTESQRLWIGQSLERLRALPATQLTHGDLFGANIIQNADETISLIDYELFAYDIAGMELAATLLRPFCRREKRRRILLRAYLATCPPQLKKAWAEYGRDFVFAAAARLALARQDRVKHVTRKDRILGIRRWLPHARDALAKQELENSKIIRSAKRNEAYYLNVARTMVELCLSDPETDPIKLIQVCDQRYREAAQPEK